MARRIEVGDVVQVDRKGAVPRTQGLIGRVIRQGQFPVPVDGVGLRSWVVRFADGFESDEWENQLIRYDVPSALDVESVEAWLGA